MTQQTLVSNPFMMLLQPEVVLAAIEKSERLSGLNRHLCRPLDRQVLTNPSPAMEAAEPPEDDGDSAH